MNLGLSDRNLSNRKVYYKDIYFKETDPLGNLFPCSIKITSAKVLDDSNMIYTESTHRQEFIQDKLKLEEINPKYENTTIQEGIVEEKFTQEYKSVEHLYQVYKYLTDNDPLQNEYAKIISDTEDPFEARMIGENITNDFEGKVSILENWKNEREEIMLQCLLAKFIQHPDLRKILLDTGDAALHLSPCFPKNTPLIDKQEYVKEQGSEYLYWSDGISSLGKDRLGALLMQVREEMRRMFIFQHFI